ncbi:hypothetical protein VP01_7079g2, partial [Puccinia sorghi]
NDVLLIWKSINEYFASQHAANRARVWNHFSYLVFDNSDVLGFITKTKASIENFLRLLNSLVFLRPSPTLDLPLLWNASAQSSTSGQKQVSLFTNASKKCKDKAHNTLANHPESRCWKLYPHLRPDYSDNSKMKEGQAEQSVSSFFSAQSTPVSSFILDSERHSSHEFWNRSTEYKGDWSSMYLS